jgi:tetratricopeptide (TPR) repeat protein
VQKVKEKKVEHFIEPRPAIGPDTSSDPEGYRQMMREGEKLLTEGRYMDAEERFTRAIAGAPNDPMARAARVHAQMGAGLYLSAATNLRALLAVSPEIAATRYADPLLPQGDRANLIAEQLKDQAKKLDSSLGRESCLLLAYLSYQRDDLKQTADGLNEFAQRIAPGDTGAADRALVQVLRASWLPVAK